MRSGRPVTDGWALKKSAKRSATSIEEFPFKAPGGGVAPIINFPPPTKRQVRREGRAKQGKEGGVRLQQTNGQGERKWFQKH